MLKKMILINSANFQFADIDVSKEIFFVGDNASGKTTTTRALHFLYNGDGSKLGIPRSKSSFSKHYFPHDDSYIIYVFKSFFIFTYKKRDTIRRWFCKREFDINEVIKNGKLKEFKEIEAYIKSASLKVKPHSIEEYSLILYGANSKYSDFAIAKIKDYKIFLDLFNMIFNIDKAIVTATDIKRAIQKSLNRRDETLSIDYEDFIRKLNSFSSSYHFFKTFDGSRASLKNALILKDALVILEEKEAVKYKAISYRYQYEIEEFNLQKELIDTKSLEIKKHKSTEKKIDFWYESFEKRLSIKMDSLKKEIMKLQQLQDKFDPLEVEENTLNANKYTSIDKDWKAKNLSLSKLQEEQTSVEKEIENQIEQLRYKIKNTIPNETAQNIYTLSEIEKSNHTNEVFEIQKEYGLIEDAINDSIKNIESDIKTLQVQQSMIELEIVEKQANVKSQNKEQGVRIEVEKSINNQKIEALSQKVRKLNFEKDEQDSLLVTHKKRYEKLRKDNAKILSSKRALFNNKILNARAIVNPIANSFNEFLSDEVDGWEKDIYPLLDKNLLKMSRDILCPELLDNKATLGFKINTQSLDSLPTKDEALDIIRDSRLQKNNWLKNSKDVYKSELAKLDEKKHELQACVESLIKQIANSIDEKAFCLAEAEKIEATIEQLSKDLQRAFENINDEYKEKRDKLSDKVIEYRNNIQSKNTDLKTSNANKQEDIRKSSERKAFNIKLIHSQEQSKAKKSIGIESEKIQIFNEQKKTLNKGDMISKLSGEVKVLHADLIKSAHAIRFLEEYEEAKDSIVGLPLVEIQLNNLSKLYNSRKNLIKKLHVFISQKIILLNEKKILLESKHKDYENGIKKFNSMKIEISEEKIETEELLINLLISYEDIRREYRNQKSKFREIIDKLRKLEKHSIIELNFNMEKFEEAKSISELDNIIDSLNELNNFEKNKYESEKKRNHNNFDTFIKLTIPGKLHSFDDLENEFEKEKASINRSLAHADFGVIRDIKLVTDSSKSRNDSIKSLLEVLSRKVKDTIGLYSSSSLFYHDIPKSVRNIEDIQSILEEIKKKSASGPINLFDTIDLSISYIENGKKIENKLNIKDESSSGGNILLKVAIAMSILNRYAKKVSSETPFFLIIDEVSKLQSKNQDLIRKYINDNGFKTLFITPDPAYPEPDKAIYYTFKNIQEEGETLEIRQMNII